MKKLALLALVLIFFLPAGLSAEIIPVVIPPAVSLNTTELTLLSGGTAELRLVLTEETAAEGIREKWTSSNPGVASVKDGTVSAGKAGSAEVTCKVMLADGNTISVSCTVSVDTPVKELTIMDSRIPMFPGDTYGPLTVKVKPLSACQEVSWTSSDPAVASVDEEGRVTACQPGQATITAASLENGSSKPKTASVKVIVRRRTETIALSEKEVQLVCRQTRRLNASVLPEDASDKKVKWESSDAKIVSVAEDGTLTGRQPGIAEITCTAEDGSGASDICSVRVIQQVTGVRILCKEVRLSSGESETLQTEITPVNATDRTLTWSSANEEIATVDAEGVVTGIAAGHCQITVSPADGRGKGSLVDVYVK